MPFEYLPVMSSPPKPPRVLVSPSSPSWSPMTRPVNDLRVALLTSAALRLENQPAFLPREDLSYRLIPSVPSAGALVIDHHSGIGRVPREDPQIVFPRSALWELNRRGVTGNVSPFHLSFMGGLRRHKEIESELAPAIAKDLVLIGVDLALLVPY